MAPRGTFEGSVRVAEHVLRDGIDTMARKGIEVPIGLTIEHATAYNHEASEVLMDRLTSLVERRRG